MKTWFVFVSFVLFSAHCWAAQPQYRIDDSKVEAAFAQSLPYALQFSSATSPTLAFHLAPDRIEDPDPATALLLSLFLGSFGLHRVYLGSDIKMVYYYVLSCFGIFGVIPLIDTLVLAAANARNDLSPYIGNNQFIMWGF